MLSFSGSPWIQAQEEEDERDFEEERFVERAERLFNEKAPNLLLSLEYLAKSREEEHAVEIGLEIFHRFRELREMSGSEVANHFLQLKEDEAAISIIILKLEEEDISEEEAEEEIDVKLDRILDLRNKLDEARIRRLKNEINEIENDIQFRLEEPEDFREHIIEDIYHELFEDEEEDFEEEEDWDDEEYSDEPEEISGPVYTPAPDGQKDLDQALTHVSFDFQKEVLVTIEDYCLDCHDSETAKGDVDLEKALSEQPLVKNLQLWKNVAERVRNGDMPPPKKRQPDQLSKQKLRAWVFKDIEGFNYDSIRNPGFVPARRLSRSEYNYVVRDLTGVDLRPADTFPVDFTGTSGFSNSANTLYIQSANLDRYFSTADWIVETLRKDHSDKWRDLSKSSNPKRDIESFMFQAYRRPPTQIEISEMVNVYEKELLSAGDHDLAMAKTFKSILISPFFLLKSERIQRPGEDKRLNGFELASRLSFFLWGSMPDKDLFQDAQDGHLASSADIKRQVDRMLSDERSFALGDVFAQEWLGVDDVGPRIRKDPIDSPWCTETLMAAMRGETAHFFHGLIMDNAPVSELITANYTYMNQELAKFYRVDGVEGDHMRRVMWEGNRRGGLLGHAAILAATSYPDRTSPVLRGTWILDTLLGTPPPPPPPNVPDLEDVELPRNLNRRERTLRARLELHRDSPNCAGCHSKIDPLGFALENFAEFGQQRRGRDSAGTLPNGATFQGLPGLKLALVDNSLDDLGKQVIRKMLAYALGRQLEYYDEGTVIELAGKLKPGGYKLRDLVQEIATSYPFTTKRLPNHSKTSEQIGSAE